MAESGECLSRRTFTRRLIRCARPREMRSSIRSGSMRAGCQSWAMAFSRARAGRWRSESSTSWRTAVRRWEDYWAVPPWVVGSATSGPESGHTAGMVGRLRQKLRVLLEEGVRVVVVASSQKGMFLPAWAIGRVEILPHGNGAYSLARELIKRQYVWSADLKDKDNAPRLTRRELLAVGSGTVAAAGLASVATGWAVHRVMRREPIMTPAMELHDKYKEALTDLAWRCRLQGKLSPDPEQTRANPALGSLNALLRQVGIVPMTILEHDVKPLEADHVKLGFRTVGKHVAYDSESWEPMTTSLDIEQRPFEAALFTGVYEFERVAGDADVIVLEMNTSGFGIVPLLERGDRVILGTRPMSEAGVQRMKTTYVLKRIPKTARSEKVLVPISCIYFNGTQDQQVRQKPDDWWGVRIQPGTQAASLAVGMPRDRWFSSVHKCMRIEGQDEKEFGTAESMQVRRTAGVAGEKPARRRDNWYPWFIDLVHADKPVVYSLRWKWEQSQ